MSVLGACVWCKADSKTGELVLVLGDGSSWIHLPCIPRLNAYIALEDLKRAIEIAPTREEAIR